MGEDTELRTMKEWQQKLDSGELSQPKPRDGKGVLGAPIFKHFQVWNILAPVLHACDLFIHTQFDCFLKWVNHQLEDLPAELLAA